MSYDNGGRAFYASLVREAAHAAEGNARLYKVDAEHLREAARMLERSGIAERACRWLLVLMIGSLIALFSGAAHRLLSDPPAASIATASPAMASPARAVEADLGNPDSAL